MEKVSDNCASSDWIMRSNRNDCLRILIVALALVSWPAFAQAPAEQKAELKAEQKTMSGTWEMSNSERDQLCNLTFRPEVAKGGFKLEFNPACVDSSRP